MDTASMETTVMVICTMLRSIRLELMELICSVMTLFRIRMVSIQSLPSTGT